MADLVSFFSTSFPDFVQRLTSEIQRRSHLPTKGRVIVVPALPGSQLERHVDGREEIIWLDVESIRQGLLLDVTGDHPLEVQGLVEPVYLQMILRLQLAGYEVVPFPYDWRRSLRSVGADLAAFIRDGGVPVDLVTHSYGSLVARAAVQQGAPGVGQVIMMGAPNRGSFDVMAGIRGNHWVLHVLAALDGNNSALDLGRQCFGTWPSVYECLPDLMSPGDLDALDPAAWPHAGLTPHPDLLAAARATRAWLAPPAPGGPRFHGIAGYGLATLQRADVADDLLHYLQSNDGDGLIPLDRAPLPGCTMYYTRCSHLGLPNHGDVIAAVTALLDGRTPDLAGEPPAPSTCKRMREDEVTEPSFVSRVGNNLGLADLKALFAESAGVL